MNQFHRPGDEKRMPVILEPENYLAWLNATPMDAVKLLNLDFPLDPISNGSH
jgi:putative SOS response-associated peptidase YedK